MRLGSKKPTTDSTDYPNRAEEVRSRRAQRSKQRISSVSSRAASPLPSRPVVVRGGSFGKPIHRQTVTRPRRQFYLTMDRAAGTELRLPALPALNPGWRLISGILALFMVAGIYALWNSPFSMINTVEVKGIQRLTVDEVNAVLDLENLSIVEVDPGLVLQKLAKTYPELINVRVRVEMPNAVVISAEERVPVLAILNGDQTSWVDESGYIFPARGDAGPLVTIRAEDNLPLVPIVEEKTDQQETDTPENTAGAKTEAQASTPEKTAAPQIVDPVTLTALQELSKILPPETQLAYSKEHGLGWQTPEGWQIFIGTDLQQFEDKYNMYQHLTNHLISKGDNPVLVSVEHLNAPYYRLEQ